MLCNKLPFCKKFWWISNLVWKVNEKASSYDNFNESYDNSDESPAHVTTQMSALGRDFNVRSQIYLKIHEYIFPLCIDLWCWVRILFFVACSRIPHTGSSFPHGLPPDAFWEHSYLISDDHKYYRYISFQCANLCDQY